jgi:hypothetical protein
MGSQRNTEFVKTFSEFAGVGTVIATPSPPYRIWRYLFRNLRMADRGKRAYFAYRWEIRKENGGLQVVILVYMGCLRIVKRLQP